MTAPHMFYVVLARSYQGQIQSGQQIGHGGSILKENIV